MGGQAITSLSLSHFRSHRQTQIVFDNRPVALWGPNGAGKTNILEAVSLLSPGRGIRRAATEDLARKPEAIGWKVQALTTGSAGSHEIESYAEGGPRQVRIDGKPARQVALARILRILWLVPSMDRLWIEAAEGRRRFLDRMTLSFAPEHAEISLAYEKAMRDRNRLLKDQVSDPHWFAALETRMAETAAQITTNRLAALARLQSAQLHAETAFPQADLELATQELEPADLAQAWADTRRRDMAAGRTLIGPHRADLAARYRAKDIPAAQCSTGEQKALLISLVLANARALAQDPSQAPVLLLDEVAAHLDESRRAALYDEICALGAQTIMTGTEAVLFADLGKRAQGFHVTETAGHSQLETALP
ncbi:MAG: DNA replication/repair protein RecF [Pseudorhodobacter sp.]